MVIELQFVGGRGLLSRMIAWFSHGWYVHVDSILPDGRLLGARFDGGVLIRPEGYKKFFRILKVTLPCNDDVTNKIDPSALLLILSALADIPSPWLRHKKIIYN